MFILQVDVREANDLQWLDDLEFKGQLAAVTTTGTEDHSLHILRIDRGEKLIVTADDCLTHITSSSYEIETRYTNGYRDYQVRLYKPGHSGSSKSGKLGVREGLYIEKPIEWKFDQVNRYTELDFKYGHTNTWWGCYLKGQIMKEQGFKMEAIEWFTKAKDSNPLRLEVLMELWKLTKMGIFSEIKIALEALELPFHEPSRSFLNEVIENSSELAFL
uniref:Uncharacterized protein n=1 Tax=Pithovirus LCPAC103 TaxID=2506588 RepID=A0A481Z487_9VIRU|nr:MAG: hypothetical protein LCPAC103_00870 [Pithovirus LCPAC103]